MGESFKIGDKVRLVAKLPNLDHPEVVGAIAEITGILAAADQIEYTLHFDDPGLGDHFIDCFAYANCMVLNEPPLTATPWTPRARKLRL
jgi:hypothetical protein